MEKEIALAFWDEVFKGRDMAYDYASHPMKRDELDTTSPYAWTLDLAKPLLEGGKVERGNYLISSIASFTIRNKRSKFRIGTAEFEVRKGKIPGAYYVFDISNKNRPVCMDCHISNQDKDFNDRRRKAIGKAAVATTGFVPQNLSSISNNIFLNAVASYEFVKEPQKPKADMVLDEEEEEQKIISQPEEPKTEIQDEEPVIAEEEEKPTEEIIETVKPVVDDDSEEKEEPIAIQNETETESEDITGVARPEEEKVPVEDVPESVEETVAEEKISEIKEEPAEMVIETAPEKIPAAENEVTEEESQKETESEEIIAENKEEPQAELIMEEEKAEKENEAKNEEEKQALKDQIQKDEEEIQNLKKDAEEKEQKIETLKAEFSALEAEKEQAEEQLRQMIQKQQEESVKEEKETIALVVKRNFLLQDKVDELTTQNQTLMSEKKEAVQQKEAEEEKNRNAIEEKSQQIVAKQKEIDELQNKANELQSKAEELQNKNDILQNEIETKEAKLQEEEESYEKTIGSYDEKLGKLQTQNDCLNEQIEEKERNYSEAQERIQALNSELEAIKQDQTQKEENEALTKQVENLENELQNLKNANEELKEKAEKFNEEEKAKLDEEINVLREKISALEEDLETEKEENAKTLQEYQGMKSALELTSGQSESDQQALLDSKKINEELQEDNDNLKKQVADLEEDKTNLEEQIEDLTEENQKGKEQIKLLTDLRESEATNKTRLEEEKEELTQEKETLEISNNELNERIKELQTEQESLTTDLNYQIQIANEKTIFSSKGGDVRKFDEFISRLIEENLEFTEENVLSILKKEPQWRRTEEDELEMLSEEEYQQVLEEKTKQDETRALKAAAEKIFDNNNEHDMALVSDFAGRFMKKSEFDNPDSEYGWNYVDLSQTGENKDGDILVANLKSLDDLKYGEPFKSNGHEYEVKETDDGHKIMCEDYITNAYNYAEALRVTKANSQKTAPLVYIYVKIVGIVTSEPNKSAVLDYFDLIDRTARRVCPESFIEIKTNNEQGQNYAFITFDGTAENVYEETLTYAILLNSYRRQFFTEKICNAYVVLNQVEVPFAYRHFSFSKLVNATRDVELICIRQAFGMSIIESTIKQSIHVGPSILPHLNLVQEGIKDSTLASESFAKMYSMTGRFKVYLYRYNLLMEE